MSKINGDFDWKESVTLKEYFTTIVKELREQSDENIRDITKEMDLKFAARDKALELQAETLRSRLDTLNEWREQNKEERQDYLTRSEYDLKHELLQTKIEQLQKIIWGLTGAFLIIDYVIKFIK
jgi:hypothetical protein